MSRKVDANYNLLIKYPSVAKEWDYEKNYPLRPEGVAPATHKKFWWTCTDCLYKYIAITKHRTLSESGCPACAGKVATKTNNLLVVLPNLAKEWDYEKNYPLRPEDITPYSNKKVWWICSFLDHHNYQSKVGHRTSNYRLSNRTGCPVCSGKVVTETNNLLVVLPNLAKEWDYEKNYPLRPEDITSCSNKKVWWICSNQNCNHKYMSKVSSRNRIENRNEIRGCPACSGRVATETNNLLVKHPNLAKEWNYEKNYPLRPEDITSCSSKKVWWICQSLNCSYHYKSTCANKTSRLSGCPACSGLVATETNNLLVKHPNLAKEWDYEKNYPLRPEDVTRGSDRKVWWTCPDCNNFYKSAISRRTCRGSGCLNCRSGGFNLEKESALYLCGSEVHQKIGIKNLDSCRYNQHKKNGLHLIQEIKSNGFEVLKQETFLKRVLGKKHINILLTESDVTDKFDGFSECWLKSKISVNGFDDLCDYIESFVDEILMEEFDCFKAFVKNSGSDSQCDNSFSLL